ncbi:MAG: ATP-binding protein [Chlorobi bacterium]|nr:ATP-binding protein [Chlorobiota bacterium]
MDCIEEGEGLTIEFKRFAVSPGKIAREMSAFANTNGGVLILGVDDDKTIVGVESEKEEIDYLTIAARELIDPPLRAEFSIFNISGLDIIVAEIQESREKPHFVLNNAGEDKAYIRVGSSSVAASKETIKVLKHRSGKLPPVRLIIGEAETRLFRWFETRDRITVKEFAELTNISERRASRLLVRLVRAGVLNIIVQERRDYFTLARENEAQ